MGRIKRLIHPAIEVAIFALAGGPFVGLVVVIAWIFPFPYRAARSDAEFQAELANYIAEAQARRGKRPA